MYQLQKDKVEQFRSIIYQEMHVNIELYQKADASRKELLDVLKRLNLSDDMLTSYRYLSYNHRMKNMEGYDVISRKLIQLEKVLPREGSMKFNSYNIRPYHNQILSIVDDILSSDGVKEFYGKYTDVLDEEVEAFRKMYGEGNREYANSKTGETFIGVSDGLKQQECYRERKIEEMRTSIANMILQNIKMFRMDAEDSGFILIPQMNSPGRPNAHHRRRDMDFQQYESFREINLQKRLEIISHGCIYQLSKGIQQSFYSQLEEKEKLRHVVNMARKENYYRY
ncbi:MAG: hypothetical protein HUJ53_09565 [Holdemanella sp.]|nr:hypothetical protein [Holdemanella sp.]